MSIGQPAHEDALLRSQRTTDFNFIPDLQQSIRLRALAVDFDLATRAGVLSFRSRFEETRDIEPDIQPDPAWVLLAVRVHTKPTVCRMRTSADASNDADSRSLVAKALASIPWRMVAILFGEQYTGKARRDGGAPGPPSRSPDRSRGTYCRIHRMGGRY
jgi:hypothetical protein